MNNFLKTMHRCQKIKKTMHKTLIIMKISFIFLVLAGLQVHASVYSQSHNSISINAEGITIREAMKQIEKNTDYRFFCSDDLVFLDRTTNLDIINLSIDEVLQQLFKSSDLGYRIFENNTVVVSLKEQLQQGIPITGVITDKDGEPLPGTAVMIKGTSQGTVTDNNGAFSIMIPNENATLVFTSLGFDPQEILVGAKRTVNVTMSENTRQLDEVVVVGYGTVKKENLTGAVDQVRGNTLENRATVSASQALQGVVANLNISNSGGAPDAKSAINIRGYTGFGSTGSPLFVIDGVASSSFQDINPNDIESISVLKDAASSAIYGSSAPYGVIIVTTKKGRIEAAPKITYSNNFGFAQPISLPKMVNSLYFAETINEACRNSGRAELFRPQTIQNIKDYQAGILKDEVTGPFPGYDEWGSWYESNANNDWFKIYYKDFSFAQQHNIGVSGGSKNSTYYVGLGYNRKNGMYNYGADSYQRFNIRTNLSSQLTNWLTFNFRGAFSRGHNDTPSAYLIFTDGIYYGIIHTWPTQPLRNPDGYFNHGQQILHIEEGGREKYISNRAAVTGEFVFKPLQGWDITVNYTFDEAFDNYQRHRATVYWHSYSGNKVALAGTSPNSFARWTDRSEVQVINAFTSYEKNLGGHYFKALAGYTQEVWDNLNYSASNQYLYTDDIPSFSTAYGTLPSISDAALQLADRGVFGRINYGYKEKYLLEFNARYDGSSKFLKDVRFKLYPGVSAAWVISKEDFWKSASNIVNILKLRASYASLGDQSPFGMYQFYPSMSTVNPTASNWIFPSGKMAYVSYPPIVNDQLTWIKTTTFDIGLDIEVLKNRLSAAFDWYVRKSDNFVGPTDPSPAVLGTSAPQANNAAMETRGFDLTVIWRDRISDFSYSARAVLSDYQGKVTKFPNNPEGLLSSWRPGQKMGEIWGYETYGLFQSPEEVTTAPSQVKVNGTPYTPGDVRYVDRNRNGEIDFGTNTESNPGDRYVIGNNTPRFAYGLMLDANYKGFDFSVFLQGVAKRDVFFDNNSTTFWGLSNSEWACNIFTAHQDRWTPDNPNGYFPKYYLNGRNDKNFVVQTRYLQNAAYMRIKNMQIGYSLPKAWLDKVHFDKARLFVNVENLATVTKLISTIDPELASHSRGEGYPLQRTWSFGINVSF